MPKQIRTGLLMLLMSLSIGLALSSTGVGQVSGSAGTSPAIPAASGSCDASLKDALECLDKALDAYEKAVAAIGAKDAHIAAMRALDNLKDQHIAVKDLMIKAQAELITHYEKRVHGSRSKLKKVLETAGKALLIATGILVGRGL